MSKMETSAMVRINKKKKKKIRSLPLEGCVAEARP